LWRQAVLFNVLPGDVTTPAERFESATGALRRFRQHNVPQFCGHELCRVHQSDESRSIDSQCARFGSTADRVSALQIPSARPRRDHFRPTRRIDSSAWNKGAEVCAAQSEDELDL